MKSGKHEGGRPGRRSMQGHSIVVIEPNRQMQHLLRGMAAGFGCRNVRIFGDMDTAVAAMLTHPPSVLLMDWDAPPYGGRSLLKLIRHERMFPLCLTPIIAMFSVAKQRQVEAAMRLGAQAVVVKPISPDVLYEHINWVFRAEQNLKLVGERYVVAGMAEQLDQESAKRKQLASARQYQTEQLDQLNSIQDDVDRILGSGF
ncbi:MAG: response regulator [Hyphomicrobiaceae bacterium]|nr:response regulator [Hyphomicrobiaceae bacterium]